MSEVKKRATETALEQPAEKRFKFQDIGQIINMSLQCAEVRVLTAVVQVQKQSLELIFTAAALLMV